MSSGRLFGLRIHVSCSVDSEKRDANYVVVLEIQDEVYRRFGSGEVLWTCRKLSNMREIRWKPLAELRIKSLVSI